MDGGESVLHRGSTSLWGFVVDCGVVNDFGGMSMNVSLKGIRVSTAVPIQRNEDELKA